MSQTAIEILNEAVELLKENKYGNPARSPAHNARLMVEDALSALHAKAGVSVKGEDEPMADGGDDNPMTPAEEVLVWLLIEKIGCPDDVSYTPNQAMKIIADKLGDCR